MQASYRGSVTPCCGYTMHLQNTGTSRAATEVDVLTSASNQYAGRFNLSSSTNWTIVVATFVAAGPLHITTQTLPDGKLNTPYSAQLAATGGTSPYSWAVVSSNFPSGLTLDPSTRVI